MKRLKKGRKKIMWIVISIVLCAVLVVGGLMIFGKVQMGKIPGMSFEDVLKYTTQGKKDARITVGIIKDGESSFTVYGADAQVLPAENHIYEIGSLTKTMTAALVSKAISEGKLSMNVTIDAYLPLSEGKNYPTIAELVTHTSGYSSFYFETPMIGTFFSGKNSFYGISRDMVLEKCKSLNIKKDSYDFNYSNFGFAVLGLILENVYNKDYTALLNDYVQKELGMASTKISERDGDLGNYWDWKEDDGYLSAGAVTSNINDMLRYAKIQLDENAEFALCHKSIKSIDASSESHKTMGIYMDEIGMAWLIDRKNGIIWHNGGTDDYNSYLGFCPDSGTAVVVLSNLSPNYRIPATVLGIKKLLELK